MNFSDLLVILQWWLTLFFLGLLFLPLTQLIFSSFWDKGYLFSKVLAMSIISYAVFLIGTLKILPFSHPTLYFVVVVALGINLLLIKQTRSFITKKLLIFFLAEELMFFCLLFLWAWVRSFQPDIQGLEKYMDFGFVNSIVRSTYFPPKDMWFPPFSINYYYFGHLITAVLTKLSLLPSAQTYNLMIATLFAYTFSLSFSIVSNMIFFFFQKNGHSFLSFRQKIVVIKSGLLAGFLVALAGNIHTIYTFFTNYNTTTPTPFWQQPFSFLSLSDFLTKNILTLTYPNAYWYPNATRFIFNTIHEFPLYSFVVSDLHGHVLSIPIVLTIMAVLLSLLVANKPRIYFFVVLLSFLTAVAFMSNASDGPIYLFLSILIILYLKIKTMKATDKKLSSKYLVARIMNNKYLLLNTFYLLLILGVGFYLFSLPFNAHFKPFISGVGVLCAPEFLTKIGKIGPFLFEIDHCQKSPLWQLAILYGFFYFWVISFFVLLLKTRKLFITDIFALILIAISTLLITIPEFFYIKDIYPAHYRANTMFKLGYQAFMMLSLCSAYIIIRIVVSSRYSVLSIKKKLLATIYILLATMLLFFVAQYPYLAVTSYYNNLQNYKGLDGALYLKRLYSGDYKSIVWFNTHVAGQPVILEAQGDSYTDYARISSNTGLPTILGWTVHEWLWRGSYDIPSPRIAEVQTLYESDNLKQVQKLLKKYQVKYIVVGPLERQKYPKINITTIKKVGRKVFQADTTTIYKVL